MEKKPDKYITRAKFRNRDPCAENSLLIKEELKKSNSDIVGKLIAVSIDSMDIEEAIEIDKKLANIKEGNLYCRHNEEDDKFHTEFVGFNKKSDVKKVK